MCINERFLKFINIDWEVFPVLIQLVSLLIFEKKNSVF